MSVRIQILSNICGWQLYTIGIDFVQKATPTKNNHGRVKIMFIKTVKDIKLASAKLKKRVNLLIYRMKLSTVEYKIFLELPATASSSLHLRGSRVNLNQIV
jgi:hypothetical protein